MLHEVHLCYPHAACVPGSSQAAQEQARALRSLEETTYESQRFRIPVVGDDGQGMGDRLIRNTVTRIMISQWFLTL